MNTPAWLDRMLGADRAELWIRDRTRTYVHLDHLAPDTALRLVFDQVAAGEPLVLASPGQVWRLPTGVIPDEHTPERVVVRARLGGALLDAYLDFGGAAPSRRTELHVQDLEGYRLSSWHWWNDPEDNSETGEETTAHRAPDDGAR